MMGTFRSRILVACVIACALVALRTGPSVAQQAADYPQGTVTIIVPLAAGGPTDLLARIVAEGMSTALKKPVIVENKPGAQGAIGTMAVARAKPDGHTLLVSGMGSIAILPTLDPKLTYQPERDLEAVALLTYIDLVITARKDLKPRTMSEIFDLARTTHMTYATPGAGSPAHLWFEDVLRRVKVEMTHVPYAGDTPSVAAVAGGVVDLGAFNAVSSTSSLIDADRIKLIAVGGPARSKQYPDVPTVGEQIGDKEFVGTAWTLMMAPKGTPKPIIDRISEIVHETLAREDVVKRLQAVGLAPQKLSPQESAKILAQDTATFKRILGVTAITRE